MYSRILDANTYAKVVAAAPDVSRTQTEYAVLVVSALWKLTEQRTPNKTRDGQFWSALIADLPDLPDGMTPKRVGNICRDLGLLLNRRNVGYQVHWTVEQLRTISDYLNVNLG